MTEKFFVGAGLKAVVIMFVSLFLIIGHDSIGMGQEDARGWMWYIIIVSAIIIIPRQIFMYYEYEACLKQKENTRVQ